MVATYPSSPQLTKWSSLTSRTQSIDPWWPLKTSWDSSGIFQIRTEVSRPPDVIALSLFNASIDVMASWWPNLHTNESYDWREIFRNINSNTYKVSTYDISSRFQILTVRSMDALNSVWVLRRKTSPVIPPLCPRKNTMRYKARELLAKTLIRDTFECVQPFHVIRVPDVNLIFHVTTS